MYTLGSVIPAGSLAIQLDANQTAVYVNSSLTYSYTVTNGRATDAHSVDVALTFPPASQISFVPGAYTLAQTAGGQVLTFHLSDLAAGLSNAITRDGQSPPTSNLPMGGRKLTGLGSGAMPGDSLPWEQLFSQGQTQDLASAATTDIGAQNTTSLRITGTTTITSFGAGIASYVLNSANLMFSVTGPVTTIPSACRGEATN